MDETVLRATLTTVLDHVLPAWPGREYRLIGTAAALLYSVQAPARDVDILLKHKEDVDAWASALTAFPCPHPPAWLPDAHQYFARHDIGGVEVESSTVEIEAETDIRETFGAGPWQHFKPLSCGKYDVPTVALELRLITELFRNRPDYFRPIVRFMQVHGCDTGYIRRALAGARVAAALQDEVLGQLSSAPYVKLPG